MFEELRSTSRSKQPGSRLTSVRRFKVHLELVGVFFLKSSSSGGGSSESVLVMP